MKKNKLSKRQKENIALGQKKAMILQDKQSGLVIAQYNELIDVEIGKGSVFRCKRKRNLGAIVVGDKVVYTKKNQEILVEAILPRKNVLSRVSERGKRLLVAANIDQVCIVISPNPKYSTYFLDKYLLAAELKGFVPIILFNKIDLISDKDQEKILADLQTYLDLNYMLVKTSVYDATTISKLAEKLKYKNNIFVGTSGVGKSSLLAHILPKEDIVTGDLSIQSGLGKHTTTIAKLYHLPSGGNIIDSPGIRDFQLEDLAREQVGAGFIEICKYSKDCKFRNCLHLEEPGCAVKEALQSNYIAESRYENYKKILKETEENKKTPGF